MNPTEQKMTFSEVVRKHKEFLFAECWKAE
jgi:hypothetical protein